MISKKTSFKYHLNRSEYFHILRRARKMIRGGLKSNNDKENDSNGLRSDGRSRGRLRRWRQGGWGNALLYAETADERHTLSVDGVLKQSFEDHFAVPRNDMNRYIGAQRKTK